MKISLVVSHGPHRGKVVPVKQAAFLIGRSSQCHLRPSSSEVGDCHCALFARNGKLYLRDLNSAAGTFVNGQRSHEEQELADADQLQIGPLKFQIRIQADLPAPALNPSVQELTRDGDVFVSPQRTRSEDEATEGLSPEEIEEAAARALLEMNGSGEQTTARDTGEIAAHSAETPPAPVNSAAAARAILNQYRQRRSGRSVTNR